LKDLAEGRSEDDGWLDSFKDVLLFDVKVLSGWEASYFAWKQNKKSDDFYLGWGGASSYSLLSKDVKIFIEWFVL
jgi:hypothetical protein